MLNMNNKQERHQLSKLLCGYVYHNGNFKLPEEVKRGEPYEDLETGFYAEVFVVNTTAFLIIRGTDTGKIVVSPRDLFSDFLMFNYKKPLQYASMIRAVEEFNDEFSKFRKVIGGQSLGGSLAQLSRTKEKFKDIEVVTFGAFGTKHLFAPWDAKNFDNITNYGNGRDPVYNLNLFNQIGDTFMIGNFQPHASYDYYDIKTHLIEHMGDISTAQKIDTRTFKEKAIYKTKNTLSKASECAGTYFVSGYERGKTHVEGYWRTCGAKHLKK